MADNFLEKRYEKLNSSGKTVIRRSNPSLETLLERLASWDSQESCVPSAAKVKRAQLDAVIRAVCKVTSSELEISSEEETGEIRFTAPDEKTAGALALAARLKAAELNLRSSAAFIHNCVNLTIYTTNIII